MSVSLDSLCYVDDQPHLVVIISQGIQYPYQYIIHYSKHNITKREQKEHCWLIIPLRSRGLFHGVITYHLLNYLEIPQFASVWMVVCVSWCSILLSWLCYPPWTLCSRHIMSFPLTFLILLYWHKRLVLRSVAVGRPTGSDVGGQYLLLCSLSIYSYRVFEELW